MQINEISRLPRILLKTTGFCAVLLLILTVVWYRPGPLQDSVITRNTNDLMAAIKTATPEELVLLLRDGANDYLASDRSLKVINQNIQESLCAAVEDCIAHNKDVDVFKIYTKSDMWVMQGKLFGTTRQMKIVINHLLMKYGYLSEES